MAFIFGWVLPKDENNQYESAAVTMQYYLSSIAGKFLEQFLLLYDASPWEKISRENEIHLYNHNRWMADIHYWKLSKNLLLWIKECIRE